MDSEGPVECTTQTSPFCRRSLFRSAGRGVGARTSSIVGGHVAMGAQDGRLTCHRGQQPDGVGAVALGQFVDRLHRQAQCLGHRLDRGAAPDERAGQDPLGSVAGEHRSQLAGPGHAPR